MSQPIPPCHEIVEGPIEPLAVQAKVESPGAGAIATFLGVVRDNSKGRQVLHLYYEAYPAMAVAEMERLEGEVRGRWQIEKMAITHRVGQLAIGEASVMIAISSPHRAEAMEACHYAIDRLKATVPVWKKEYWVGGEVWVEGPGQSVIHPPGSKP